MHCLAELGKIAPWRPLLSLADRLRLACMNRMVPALVLLGILSATQALSQGTLLYNGTNITERWQNDGWFNAENSITVTLTNSANSFTATTQDFIALGYITPINVPYGLTATATRTASKTIMLALAGRRGPAASDLVPPQPQPWQSGDVLPVFGNRERRS